MLTISSASLLALTFSTAVKNSPRVVCSSNCSTGPPIIRIIITLNLEMIKCSVIEKCDNLQSNCDLYATDIQIYSECTVNFFRFAQIMTMDFFLDVYTVQYL